MPLSSDQFWLAWATLGIATKTVEHPPAFTVAESSTIQIPLPGAHTKNLFLKDEKGRLSSSSQKARRRSISRSLAKRLGMGRFSFGKPELLMDVLGVDARIGNGICRRKRQRSTR